MRTSVFWVAVLSSLVGACGSGGVTEAKLEAAFAPAFANLVHVQEAKLGLPAIDAALLKPSATCRKVMPEGQTTGGGNWKCSVTWSIPGQHAPVHDAFDLSVTMDGCYTATVEQAHLGGPTLQKRDGTSVVNLLYVFDGCFDAS